ncbi:MAG: YncE family protein [Bacteroidota bacterium]|nr:YncE family protein [Bacteroidota bacterium]
MNRAHIRLFVPTVPAMPAALMSLVSLLSLFFFSRCQGQPSFGKDQLKLTRTIPMPEVKGRIDHMDVNLKEGFVYVAALGNNTLEVVDLANGRVLHSITGLDEPQGIGYIPQTRELFVANGGSGDGCFYNARTYEKLATIHLGSDADDVRVDSASRKIYVGYGSGGIAVIDPVTHRQVGDIKLPAHPESFQLDKSLSLLFVNLPDVHQVGVVDLKRGLLVGRWEDPAASANFPMAVDTIRHRVFVGYRRPARLVVFDGRTGSILNSEDMTGDADDLYYYSGAGKLFVSGGAGAISIFREEGGTWQRTANIPTRTGARTSLLIPALNSLVVAARAASGQPASLLVYTFAP